MSSLPPAPSGFLDAAGGAPMAGSVADAYARASQLAWADPMRLHHRGRQSALLLDTARASLAASISAASGARIGAEQIFFAPNMRQAATWAAQGFLGEPGFVASAIETLAVLDGVSDHTPVRHMLPVDEQGRVLASAVDDLASPEEVVVVLQAANGEIGTLQDLQLFAERGFSLIVDANHCLGRIALGPHWSVLMLSTADLGGPAGLVVMAVQPNARWSCPLPHTGGWISGRVDVPAVVATATAVEIVLGQAPTQAAAQFALIERLRASINSLIADVTFAGDEVVRLPHLLNCSILYVSGEALVLELDRRGFAVASGSACAADSDRASHVLAAIGGFTGGNLRISLPFNCDEATADSFVDALVQVVAELRQGTGL